MANWKWGGWKQLKQRSEAKKGNCRLPFRGANGNGNGVTELGICATETGAGERAAQKLNVGSKVALCLCSNCGKKLLRLANYYAHRKVLSSWKQTGLLNGKPCPPLPEVGHGLWGLRLQYMCAQEIAVSNRFITFLPPILTGSPHIFFCQCGLFDFLNFFCPTFCCTYAFST